MGLSPGLLLLCISLFYQCDNAVFTKPDATCMYRPCLVKYVCHDMYNMENFAMKKAVNINRTCPSGMIKEL